MSAADEVAARPHYGCECRALRREGPRPARGFRGAQGRAGGAGLTVRFCKDPEEPARRVGAVDLACAPAGSEATGRTPDPTLARDFSRAASVVWGRLG